MTSANGKEWPIIKGYSTAIKDGDSSVAVCCLGGMLPGIEGARITGPLMTENLGIERLIANVISNVNIRALVVCGKEVKGHMSGQALLSLHKAGIEPAGPKKGLIRGAKGAMPYIMNLDLGTVHRFMQQVNVVKELLGCEDVDAINAAVRDAQFEADQYKPFPGGPVFVKVR